ncbi:MAG: NAD-dependent epimerase/dehydratase family protein [Planctomycetota bacterium]
MTLRTEAKLPHSRSASSGAPDPAHLSDTRAVELPATAPLALRPSASPLRVAVVGAGYIADYHLAVLRETEGVSVEAICDTDVTRARALGQRYGVAACVTKLSELAALKIHVAHLLVPPELHVPLAREILELGISVFVEKPLALTSQHARELGLLAASRGLALAVNHNNLYHPAFARLLQRVHEGEIGRVEHVQVTLSVPLMQLDAGDYSHWMFRAPHNIVFEQAVHPLCQVHALIGRVRSASTTLLSSRELLPAQVFHDRWAVAARGEHATAEIYLAFGQGFTQSTLRVLGSDGSLSADLAHNALDGERKTVWLDFWNSFLAVSGRGRALRRDALRGLFHYLRFTLGLGRREDAFYAGMRGAVQAFYAALQRGERPPNGGETAAQVLEWCEGLLAGVSNTSAPRVALPAPIPARPGEVVVLGGTGFLGQRVIDRLLAARVPVTLVVRRTHSLPASIVAAAQDGRVRLVTGSLEDPAALERALQGADVVLQIATGGGDTWEKIQRGMIDGSVAAAHAALAQKARRFVFVSSIAALYTGGDDGANAIEDSLALDPRPDLRSLYARGKIAAEEALVKLFKERGLPLTIVRPGVVLGAGTPMQHSGFGLWTRDNHCIGWGIGDHALPAVWVDDVADALVALARYEKKDLDGRALNLCANVDLTAQDYVRELRAVTGRDLHFHPRPLWKSQTMEIGKWLVKKAGRRAGVEFPSYHDLKARALVPKFTCRLAREKLGWKPVEEREAFLERTVRVYAPKS